MATLTQRPWLHNITPYLVYIVLITAVGPLQFGYHLAELNAPEDVITCHGKSAALTSTFLNLPQCIPMTRITFGLVTSIYTIGGGIGSLASGPCSTKYGRLPTMRFTTIFFVLGPVFEALAPNVPILSIGRFLSGLGAGAAIVVVPVYISEVAPVEGKGLFGALTQVMINVGILFTQSLGYFLSRGQLWRLVLAVGGAIGLSQLLGLLAVPESPHYLNTHGKPDRARRVLQAIRGKTSDINPEIQTWSTSPDPSSAPEEEETLLAPSLVSSPSKSPASIGIFEILYLSHYRSALLAVIGVMLAQQLCGINSIIMYSVSLLSTLLPTTSALLTVAVSAINLFATILLAPLADRLGRKPCLLLSITGMGSMSLCLACSIYFELPVVSAIAVLLFVVSFAVGLGPVPFILASELVGAEAVAATQSWALVANWTATFMVAQFFPVLNRVLGKGRVYFLFAALAGVFFAFVWWWVPETKGKKDADGVWGRDPPRVD